MENILFKLKGIFLGVFFPIECIDCGQEGKYLCNACFKKIKLRKHQICPVCKKKSFTGKTCENCSKKTYLDGVVVASYHKDDLLKKSIHYFKYLFVKDLGDDLSHLLIKILKKEREELLSKKSVILVPLPLYKKRLLFRGFNQSEVLAKKVGEFFNIKVRTDLVARIKETKPQMSLERKERLRNVKQAFTCTKPKLAANKFVVLVDDVMTTGQSLSECARVLKKAGAREVWGLVLARG